MHCQQVTVVVGKPTVLTVFSTDARVWPKLTYHVNNDFLL